MCAVLVSDVYSPVRQSSYITLVLGHICSSFGANGGDGGSAVACCVPLAAQSWHRVRFIKRLGRRGGRRVRKAKAAELRWQRGVTRNCGRGHGAGPGASPGVLGRTL